MPPTPLPPPWDRFVPFVQRVFVWASVFGILWVLRPFFFMVFLTFVFGYMLQHFVERMDGKIRSRRVRVVTGFLALLLLLIGVGWTVGPSLAKQARDFPGQIKANLDKIDSFIDRLRRESPSVGNILPQEVNAARIVTEAFGFEGVVGAEGVGHQRIGRLLSNEALAEAARGLAEATEGLATASEGGEGSYEGLSKATDGLATVARSLNSPSETKGDDGILASAPRNLKEIIPTVLKVAERSLAIGSAFLLSLLFSFLIVLDFPALARGARHLHDTRLQFVYDEVSDSVSHFGRVLGQALEAQLMIALLNTALTAAGLNFMGLPNVVFLSMIVFICSFIPVAGVFISSVPICLTALTVGDISLLMWSVVFITVIHMIEAYILNPRIYGAHLRMNPVLVLGILVMSHHLFGVWGLILGVPVVNYFVKFVIEVKARRQDEVGTITA